uniref:Elongation factor Tu, mitochondrial-like n=1 Tax=Cicer arietinum TaxID=3827 RepID=A0A3Q7XJK0_CICAR|nr:elongation factor Tu, mitochondrial-like [Cicer arietinum]
MFVMYLIELLSFFKFPGDEIPIIRDCALSALQGTNEEIGRKAILKLMDAVDEYIPDPVSQLDKPFLMPIEDVFSIQGGPLKTTLAGVEMFKKILGQGQIWKPVY